MNAFFNFIILASTISLRFHFASTVGEKDPSLLTLLTPRQEECLDNIYRDMYCKRPNLAATNRSRLYLPKKFLGSINYNELNTNDAKNYLMYLHDLITTLVIKNQPKMLNPHEFCEEATKDVPQGEKKLVLSFHFDTLNSELEYAICRTRLSEVYRYSDITNTTEILKNTFLYLNVTTLPVTNDYAYDYFHHMVPYLGFSVDTKHIMLPEDFCIGPSYSKFIQSLSPRKRGYDSEGAGSSKSKRASFGNN